MNKDKTGNYQNELVSFKSILIFQIDNTTKIITHLSQLKQKKNVQNSSNLLFLYYYYFENVRSLFTNRLIFSQQQRHSTPLWSPVGPLSASQPAGGTRRSAPLRSPPRSSELPQPLRSVFRPPRACRVQESRVGLFLHGIDPEGRGQSTPHLRTPSPPVPPPPLLLIRRQKYSRGSGCELGCALGEHAAQTPRSANQTFCQPRPVQSYYVCRLGNNNHTTIIFLFFSFSLM